jgi:hypothetical protein
MEKTRPSPKNLERGDIQSHEEKRPKNGRMEQQKAMEYGSRKASSDVVNPRNIYTYMYIYNCINILGEDNQILREISERSHRTTKKYQRNFRSMKSGD